MATINLGVPFGRLEDRSKRPEVRTSTASATDLASPRCFDDKMLERFADAIAALKIRDSNFACL